MYRILPIGSFSLQLFAQHQALLDGDCSMLGTLPDKTLNFNRKLNDYDFMVYNLNESNRYEVVTEIVTMLNEFHEEKEGYVPYDIDVVYNEMKETETKLGHWCYLPKSKDWLPIEISVPNDLTDIIDIYTGHNTLKHLLIQKRVVSEFILPRQTLSQTVHNWRKNIEDYHTIALCFFTEAGRLDNAITADGFRESLIHGDDQMYYDFRLREHIQRDQFKKPNNAHISLKKDAKEFFKPHVAVPYFFVHDELHEVVMTEDRPIYELMLVPGEQVLPGQKRMKDLSQIQMAKAACEEACVLGLERLLLPMLCGWKGPIVNQETAFYYGLMRICTNITSGYFKRWCIEHYPEIIKMYHEQYKNYFQKALLAITLGIIKRDPLAEEKHAACAAEYKERKEAIYNSQS